MNQKKTSKLVASVAAKVMSDKNASQIQKSLAASALAQSASSKQTGKAMDQKASAVLQTSKYNEQTKEFAGSVLSQSNKNARIYYDLPTKTSSRPRLSRFVA